MISYKIIPARRNQFSQLITNARGNHYLLLGKVYKRLADITDITEKSRECLDLDNYRSLSNRIKSSMVDHDCFKDIEQSLMM